MRAVALVPVIPFHARFDGFGGGYGGVDPLAAQLRRVVEPLLRASKKFILVYPVPKMPVNLPNFLAKKLMFTADAGDLSLTMDKYRSQSAKSFAVLSSVAAGKDIEFVYPHVALSGAPPLTETKCCTGTTGTCLSPAHTGSCPCFTRGSAIDDRDSPLNTQSAHAHSCFPTHRS